MTDFATTGFCERMQQHPDALGLLKPILQREKFDRIIEIGTGTGVFTAWLKQFTKMLITVDITNRRLESVDRIVYLICDAFGRQFPTEFAKLMDQEQKTLLICDDGNKPREAQFFGPQLRTGDMMLVHDYASENWPWPEFTDKDVPDGFKRVNKHLDEVGFWCGKRV